MNETIDIKKALKTFFGFNGFKGSQEKVINSIISGRDTFVIMPTGGGKSLCYQLPAIISPGTAIIISPLIALMKNQVDMVRAYSNMDYIAHFLNSSLTRTQAIKVKKDLVSGRTKLLFVAPETLTKEENISFFKDLNISFVAVDEAHCISEWGHDFRPEYRRIREMIDGIGGNIPIIALTATATPKVSDDIIKNLKMKNPNVFLESFLRKNLYYEIRPKREKSATLKDLVKFVKSHQGKSGIIYCLNRKTTEELAEVLNVNGVLALPYHAGLDSGTRTKAQDMFMMEEVNVIVATIAFGMGIDKPDVRFVVHYNVPKSLENYYQETGRAGRDGLEGICLSYYSYKDIFKLEKFLRDKPVAEREIGSQHLMEVSAYAESTACRRQFLLHYFGETYDTSQCGNGECDNCRFPKEKIEAKDEVILALKTIDMVNENYGIPYIVSMLTGNATQEIQTFDHDKLPLFGKGSEKDATFWNSIVRHALLNNLIRKDIEQYGLLKITEQGREYMANPQSLSIPLNHNYEELETGYDDDMSGKGGALDPELFGLLKDLCKKIAREKNLPPYVIFQDPSLEDMATQYPINLDELANITGVSQGKALRYGRPFIEMISQYVEDNEIERLQDVTIKSVVQKSGLKVYIIQNIDRKITLEDIARAKDLNMDELITEIESIVMSGTKLDLDYYLNDAVDEEAQDIIYDYFMSANSDSLQDAYNELEEEGISIEEIQLIRIKFLSEMAN